VFSIYAVVVYRRRRYYTVIAVRRRRFIYENVSARAMIRVLRRKKIYRSERERRWWRSTFVDHMMRLK